LREFVQKDQRGSEKHWKPKFATPLFVPRYKEKVEGTLRHISENPTSPLNFSESRTLSLDSFTFSHLRA
jgi:hypothetical protein